MNNYQQQISNAIIGREQLNCSDFQQQQLAYSLPALYQQVQSDLDPAMHIGSRYMVHWNVNAPVFYPSSAQHGNATVFYKTNMNRYDEGVEQQSHQLDDFQFFAANDYFNADQTNFYFNTHVNGTFAAAETSQLFAFPPQLTELMMHEPILHEIQVGLERLIAQPEEFDTWSSAIRDRFVDKSITSYGLQIATQLIIEMALLGFHNVQYSLAKLFGYLSNTIESNNNDGNKIDFRTQLLLPQLNIYHTEKRSFFDLSQQQNLAYLFAEILTHFETQHGKHFEIFIEPIFEQLHTLLNASYMESSVKTVVQILKLTGHVLERCATNGNELINAIFILLTDAVDSGDISISLQDQIKNLYILRSNEWGRNRALSTQSPPTTNNENSSVNDDTLYIGPDGTELTFDERAFLEENCGFLDSSSSIDDRECIDDYETFLASNPEKNQ